MYKICIKGVYLNPKPKQTTMNRLKTLQEKRNEQYKAESLSGKWFWYIMGGALLLTAFIENL
jgi:hypothetical protein